jgi:hypothetical protein
VLSLKIWFLPMLSPARRAGKPFFSFVAKQVSAEKSNASNPDQPRSVTGERTGRNRSRHNY